MEGPSLHDMSQIVNRRPLRTRGVERQASTGRASSLQFVRKLSGFNRPSKANEEAFNRAVAEVAHAACHLIDALVTTAPPRDREVEAEKARARSALRFARP